MEWLVWDIAWQKHRSLFFLLMRRRSLQTRTRICCSCMLMEQFTSKMGLHQILPTFLDNRKRITVHHMACQTTRTNVTWLFFLREFVKGHQCVIWQTYKRRCMLLSTMWHHRCFITHGSRLNTGWTFPVPLMEAMLRFMEHKVRKNRSFHSS